MVVDTTYGAIKISTWVSFKRDLDREKVSG